jgi:hypothetical protein
LFSQVQDFLLYDFYTPEGSVNEDVFAYSNKAGDERALVVYHNKFASTRGWIRISAAYSVKSESGDHLLVQKKLGEGLGLSDDSNTFCIFRDLKNNLEYIRNSKEISDQGLYIELEAYTCRVFTSFSEIQDNEWHQYANLAGYLNGRGVPDINEALKEIILQPVHQAYRELVNPGFFRWVITNRNLDPTSTELETSSDTSSQQLMAEVNQKTSRLMEEVNQITQSSADVTSIVEELQKDFIAILSLPHFPNAYRQLQTKKYQSAIKYLHAGNVKNSPWVCGDTYTWSVALGWLFTSQLGRIISNDAYEEISRSWVDEWVLNKILVSTLNDLGLDERSGWRAVTLVKLLTTHHSWWKTISSSKNKKDGSGLYQVMSSLLSDSDALTYLGVNRYQDILWFNKEAIEDLFWWLFIVGLVEIVTTYNQNDQSSEMGRMILACNEAVTNLLNAAQESGYKLEKLLALLK